MKFRKESGQQEKSVKIICQRSESRMIKSKQELVNLVRIAINEFNQKEKYLLKNDLSERCICAQFAMYLSKCLINSEYTDYKVDVEYSLMKLLCMF